jgi:hypothetical protein
MHLYQACFRGVGADRESHTFVASAAMADALQQRNYRCARHWGRAVLRFGRREGSSVGRAASTARSCTPAPATRRGTPAPATRRGTPTPAAPGSITHPRY